MTDQSRVEAVARAIYAAGRGEFGIRPDHPSHRARKVFEDVWRAGGVNDDQRDDIKLVYMQAQAAIEANDAWLKENVNGVAREIRKAEARSMGLNYTDDDWIHDRNRMSERWHITMGKAQSAINATISQKETDR